jgi:glucosamine kinase
MDPVYVIGVDGGGTKTLAWIAGEDAKPLGEATGPASAVIPGAERDSAEVIAQTVREAVRVAGLEDAVPRALCAGLAGVGREAQRAALLEALEEMELAAEVMVRADAAIAMDDAFDDGPGILLIAGTGSVAFGRGPTGEEARVGGWGPICGDEGSGAWIGRRALSVVTASSDGREPETALTGAILTAAEVNEVDELVPWAARATPAQLATLAPVVAAVADAGDLRANSIMTLAAEELVLHVRALARRLFGDERADIPVAMSGGLISPGGPLRRRVEHRLRSAVPGAHVRAEPVVPVRGAVKSALRVLEKGLGTRS